MLFCGHIYLGIAIGWEYAAVIDAGSTGSRIHIFKYYLTKGERWPNVDLPQSVYKTTPGLSAYSFEAKTGANSLQPLLKFAKQTVPANQWSHTPIQLLATAGLRMLSNDTAQKLLGECRKLLSESGFQFDESWVHVIDGQQEGLFGWVAVNYATGALQALAHASQQQQQQPQLGRKEVPGGHSAAHKDAQPATPLMGVLELGGASMQITYTPHDKIPATQAVALDLPGAAIWL
eukprot:jgi/Chrzof1/2855/Cz12g01110.t1